MTTDVRVCQCSYANSEQLEAWSIIVMVASVQLSEVVICFSNSSGQLH